MLAPEPFFEPRGTPFSEYHRIKTLVELGYRIDLVTYPIGQDVDLPNLRIYRCAKPPFVTRVAIGPSFVKILLDLTLAVTALRLARPGRYAAIHSHEEAGALGVWLARRRGIPHLYDMHSSLPQQLTNFSYSRSRLIRWILRRSEQAMIDGSRVVITICQALQDTAVETGAGDRAILIENVMGGDLDDAAGGDCVVPIREQWGISVSAPLVLYTGTFEAYQGLELLYGAAARLKITHPEARVLIVGGEPDQVTAARAAAERDRLPVVFTGRRPAQEIPSFVAACDILASPRIAGTNTPLKIYSYLRSGRPIVATDLRTHTQVLEPGTAVLVPPEPAAFAAAVGELIDDPDARAGIAAAAGALSARKYSRASYIERTREAYRRLLGAGAVPDQMTGVTGSASAR
jgi:glycosyltransferase involved in cell wall biosynthesis